MQEWIRAVELDSPIRLRHRESSASIPHRWGSHTIKEIGHYLLLDDPVSRLCAIPILHVFGEWNLLDVQCTFDFLHLVATVERLVVVADDVDRAILRLVSVVNCLDIREYPFFRLHREDPYIFRRAVKVDFPESVAQDTGDHWPMDVAVQHHIQIIHPRVVYRNMRPRRFTQTKLCAHLAARYSHGLPGDTGTYGCAHRSRKNVV